MNRCAIEDIAAAGAFADPEDVEYLTSPAFWQMIQSRRGEATLAWADVKRELLRVNTEGSVG